MPSSGTISGVLKWAVSVKLTDEKELRNRKMVVVVCVSVTRCHTRTEMFGVPELREGGSASFTGPECGGECVLYHVQPCGAAVIHVVREWFSRETERMLHKLATRN